MMPTGPVAVPTACPFSLESRHPAVKLAGLVLALIGWLALPGWCLPGLWVLQVVVLWLCGFAPSALGPSVRPWLPIALLVLLVHSLTTVEAAPLGRPSWAGLGQGVLILSRVAGTVASLACYLRITRLGDLVAGVSWWLAPARRLGLDTTKLSLAVAVAIGTIPLVLARSRRIEATVRLRQTSVSHPEQKPRRLGHRLRNRAQLLVPLLEDLFRRAEGLTLSVQNRLPAPAAGEKRPGLGEGLILIAWTCLLGIVIFG